jgi:hypothetical protein
LAIVSGARWKRRRRRLFRGGEERREVERFGALPRAREWS